MTSELDALWKKFDCINLEKTTGKEKTKNMPGEKHIDIKRDKDALYFCGTNKKVNHMNNKRLKSLKGEELILRQPASTKQ